MTEIEPKEEVTPDDLMEQFRGRKMPTIVIFTIVVHAIVLLGTSVPYLMETVLGADANTELSEQDRLANAVREANETMRKIAEKHGVKPQELSSQFDGPKKPTTAKPEKAKVTPKAPDIPEKPKTAIEKELEVKSDGPSLPKIDDNDGEEDLFK